MTIVLTWKHARRLGFLLTIASLLTGTFFIGYQLRGQPPTVENTVAIFETKICGSFENPEVAMGIPLTSQNEYIIFEDGFLLRLSKPHSFFAERLGLFMLNGSDQSYALVTDADFHPCPSESK